MKSQDLESPPYPRHNRHHQNKLIALAQKYFNNRRGYAILLIFSFILGYIVHAQPLLSLAANDLYAHNDYPNRCSNPVPSDQIRQTVLNKAFNETSPWQNFPPAHVSKLLFKEWAKGWGSQAPVFEHLIDQVKPMTIIEVGTFLGASAIHMYELTRKLGLDSQIICIDDFRGWPGYYDEDNKSLKMVNGDSLLLYQFMQNVVVANATESIVFLPFSAGTALGGLCDWGVFGDLVEIDAAHDFHSAWVDINNAYKVLKPGGVMFGHDYVWVGVRKAVHIFARLNGFRVRVDGEHWVLY